MPIPAIPQLPAEIAAQQNDLSITQASLRGSPSDRIIKPRPRKDSLQSISGSDSVPGRIVKPRARKSPGSGAKRSEPAKRKFICSFSHYGCDVALSSKNEWKRHVSIQHLQLGFYRCDVGPCNPELNPGVPGHKRVYNDFNRKDLFTQHHRRMHKPETGPGSGTFAPGSESSADWKAFEDTLEGVRQRCWVEKRKPPQRSTCGFCGRIFEGDGSWNDRMEHVGGHFSRDVIEAKEEREDEDLTNWAIQEGIVKEVGGGRNVLADQPPSTSVFSPNTHTDSDSNNLFLVPGQELPLNHSLIDPSISNAGYSDPSAFSPTSNGLGQSASGYGPAIASTPTGQWSTAHASQPLGSPTSERRNYNLAPPPLGGLQESTIAENGSGDRLEDLIHQLTKPKEPQLQRRLTWKCVCPCKLPYRNSTDCQQDCNRTFSVDIDETDTQAIQKLQEISIVCSHSQAAYLKTKSAGKYKVVKCDELGEHVWKEAKKGIDTIGSVAPEMAAA